MKVTQIRMISRGIYAHICPYCGKILSSACSPDMLPKYSKCDCLKPGRFRLEKSKDTLGVWVLTDTENLIVARFKDGDFNGSLKISFIDDNAPVDASQIAKAMREMGTWISVHHLSIASPQPHGVEYGEDGCLYLYRNKYPQWRMKITDCANNLQLAASLNKAAAWLKSEARRVGWNDTNE